MTQLIVLRALQGLGGGGLLVVTMAAIADVIPPAERGRFQGVFGGVFGLATVIGPLLGGFLVEHLSWRWIFYINLPLGIISLAVIGAVFKPHVRHVKHTIDYMGAAFLAGALTCIILFTSQGGTILPWSSPQLWFTLGMGLRGDLGLHPRRAHCRRTDHAARTLQTAHVFAEQSDRLHHRRVAVRLGHVPAAVSAGGQRLDAARKPACRCCR